MIWKNVKLIFLREMRDQLRDRRTLFLIAVLPLLLYPILGASFFQLSQFLQHEAAKVAVVGADELDGMAWLPPLVTSEYFDVALFDDPVEQANLELVEVLANSGEESVEATVARANKELADGNVQLVLYFPPGFGERLRSARAAVLERRIETSSITANALPEPEMFFKSVNEKSLVAQRRVARVLRKWRSRVAATNLQDSDVPVDATEPFKLRPRDMSLERQRTTAMWSKILPFFVFIWALTGAFYPAVDLCAGEKERGTLETLLASPALRREIVWGKLLTVMAFSIGTALLNLLSISVTASFVVQQLNAVTEFAREGTIALPPISSLVWLIIGLVPVAGLFSALCLAFAAFARSTKEGQYYLMPLLLVIMPLMMLTLSPGVELNLGNSLIPVTGVVLLLRALMEGQYAQALPFVLPVVGVTLTCCLLAIRWAEEQFNRESVLFRESERLELGRWLVHLVRDRTETPTLAQAALCIALIVVLQFFIGLAASAKSAAGYDYHFVTQSLFIVQVVCIALPAAMMTLVLTSRPWKTLLLDKWPRASHLAIGAALAALIRPLGMQLSQWVVDLYPPSAEVAAQIGQLESALQSAPNWWVPLAMIAVLPAVCEELAFRGFILSGLRHLGHKWWAIGLSSVAFGMAHPILQQKLAAVPVGLVIGYLAVQTGSLGPCVVFHAVYNALGWMIGDALQRAPEMLQHPAVAAIVRDDALAPNAPGLFQPWFLIACGVSSAGLLWWLRGIDYRRTDEEQLTEARQRQEHRLAGA